MFLTASVYKRYRIQGILNYLNVFVIFFIHSKWRRL